MVRGLKRQSAVQRGKELCEGSFFIRILTMFADFIYRGVENSFAARFFTAAKDYPEKLRQSLLWRVFLEGPARSAKKVKMWFAAQFEDSVILNSYTRLSEGFFRSSLRSLGAGMLSFGAMAAVIDLVQIGRFDSADILSMRLVIAVLFCAGGLVMMLGRGSIAEGVRTSRLMRTLFIWAAGIREEWFEQFEKPQDNYVPFIGAGILLGLATKLFPPYLPLLAAAGVVFGLVLLRAPEFGVMAELFLLPFLPTMLLAALGVATLAAFLLKYIRGKRVMKASYVTLFAAFFFVMQVLMAIKSPARASSLRIVMIYFAFVSVAFVLANTFRTQEMIRKAVYALLAGGIVSAAVGVYQKIVGVEQSLIWVDTSMFSDIDTRVFGTFDNPNVFGEYLVMLMPVAFALFLIERGRRRVFPGVTFLIMGASLIFTYSRGAWLAAMISLALFAVFYHKYFFMLGVCGIAAIPFLPAVLPSAVVNRFLSIGNMADTSTSYRFSIWQAAVRMMKDLWATGSGIGSDAFLMVYPQYALAGAQYALHSHNLYFQMIIEVGALGALCFALCLIFNYKNVFSCFRHGKSEFERLLALGLGCGTLAMLIQAATDNVWYNFRIFLLFWVLIGMTAAIYREFREGAGDRG